MAYLKTLFIFMVCFASQVFGSPLWKEYFSVQVREGKTDFQQKVEIDMAKQQTYLHVPAHNDLQETETFSDIKEGYSILCYKEDGYCILRKVEDTGFGDIDGLKKGMENVQLNGGEMNANTAMVVHQYLTVNPVPIIDLSFLKNDAITFLGGRPLHNSTTYKLPPNAKFLADSSVDKRKQKRAVDIQPSSYFICNSMPEYIWGYTTNTGGEHITVCGRDNYNHICLQIHDAQHTLMKYLCCPGVYVLSKCICMSHTQGIIG
ncbi:uncharacterized protein LOC106152409 [Lingula anatina]|uniref:Uncharacterized protein LOC106152409 n=1 Tax=Lingula anatina TaxID=7574 RepID=A0A1S3H8G7_LINAN|nr:uncharacterized protein LOC106152409 [Lingula anatina]|eukprot:XP_013381419.1 uncharacterized protein LOC106152409 [Lingula anatina]